MRIDFRKTLLLILICVSVNLQAQDSESDLVEQNLTWETIEGAWGYEVVIREGDQEIISTQIQESQFKFSLPPGEYEFSIRILNKFKKVESATDWKPLIILEAFQPVIRKFSPQRDFLRTSGRLVLTAEVYQVRQSTRFFLTSSDGKEVEGSTRILGEESLEISFPMNELEPGDYLLSALDPSGLDDQAEAFPLTLLPIIKPEIKDVSIRNIQQQQVYTGIEVRGENFDEGIEVKITRQGQEFTPYELVRKSSELLVMSIITGDHPPGRYSLELLNPSGESDLRKNSFFMEEAPQMEEIRQTPPAETAEVMGGIVFAGMIDQSHGESDPFFPGITLKARQDLVNARFWNSPGLRSLGVELTIDTSQLKYRNAPFIYNQLYTGFSVYYRIKLARGWSLIPKLGLGGTTLWVTEEGIFGPLVQGDAGYAAGSGLSLQRLWKSGFLMEGGMDFRYIRYTGGYFNTLHSWLAGGFRF